MVLLQINDIESCGFGRNLPVFQQGNLPLNRVSVVFKTQVKILVHNYDIFANHPIIDLFFRRTVDMVCGVFAEIKGYKWVLPVNKLCNSLNSKLIKIETLEI
jgi:hypothetical protein